MEGDNEEFRTAKRANDVSAKRHCDHQFMVQQDIPVDPLSAANIFYIFIF